MLSGFGRFPPEVCPSVASQGAHEGVTPDPCAHRCRSRPRSRVRAGPASYRGLSGNRNAGMDASEAWGIAFSDAEWFGFYVSIRRGPRDMRPAPQPGGIEDAA